MWGFLVAVTVVVLAAFAWARRVMKNAETRMKAAPQPVAHLETLMNEARDLGEGIYLICFHTVSQDLRTWMTFPDSLVNFRRTHPNLRITAMFAGADDYRGTQSVLVVTEPREVSAGEPTSVT